MIDGVIIVSFDNYLVEVTSTFGSIVWFYYTERHGSPTDRCVVAIINKYKQQCLMYCFL